MKIIETLQFWCKKFIGFCQDLIVPEDIKVQKLIALPANTMRNLLPKSPVYNKDIIVLFDYQNQIIRLIVKFIKYKNNANLRKRVAQYLSEEIIDLASEIALFEGNPPLLIPMPMSSKEKKERGFNQCEELAKEIKKLVGENIEVSYNVLKKIKETERQTKLGREQRLENVKNSMSASDRAQSQTLGKEPKIKNRVVIVLDDVYTTGASLIEARRALLAAGAKRVIGLFIAH